MLCYQLQMGTLQSRLDADFLLAHMCSVKFKEWIVVLATLLRRSEVCWVHCVLETDLKLYRHDFINSSVEAIGKTWKGEREKIQF